MLKPTLFTLLIWPALAYGQTTAQPAAPAFVTAGSPQLSIACAPTAEEERCLPGPTQICINAQNKIVRDPVVSLSKNKQLRVTVYNKNPFGYQYKLKLDETTIIDDDVSGFLKLFLPAAGKADAQQAGNDAKTKSADTKKSVLNAGASPTNSAFFVQNLKTGKHVETFAEEHAQETGRTPEEEVQKLQTEIGNAATLLVAQIERYQQFAAFYENIAVQLSKQESCTALEQPVNELHQKAVETRQKLLEVHPQIVSAIQGISDTYAHLNEDANKQLAQKTREADPASIQPEKGKEADALTQLRQAQKDLKAQQDGRKQLDDLKQSALRLECMYLDFGKKQISGLQYGVIDPLEQAVSNTSNFWRTEAIGSYSDATTVTITNQRKPVEPAKPLPPATFPQASGSGNLCSKELLSGNDFAGAEFSVASASTDATAGSSAPADDKKKSSSKKGSSAASDDKTTETGYEPDGRAVVHFGGQRFITAAGVGFGLLPKPQFVRVSGTPTDANGTPTSTTVTNIVGLKSESDVRISPFLFLHTRLFSLSHNPQFLTNEALFFSFGVGAQTDNQGARSEYLIGLSHSLADQHFFVTVGTYIGKQQVLKNGLFVGRDVSGLQGELPIDEVTHFKLGIALSYRFNIGGSGSVTTNSADKSKKDGGTSK
jgi:hypothetical protein